MPVIGTFAAIENGYAGSLSTLSFKAELSILVNPRQEGRNAPDFLLMAGPIEVGAAWRRTSQGAQKIVLRVKLDDPTLPEPIWAALLEPGADGIARLLWQRDWEDDRA
jgi:uncharacterized protein (DUF736 family)